ncbi:MAG: hypothetical protein HQK54_14070, partial [Oligoflexales bacterium]|nr:hypothetical protein [Oligoflexales bacterium]
MKRVFVSQVAVVLSCACLFGSLFGSGGVYADDGYNPANDLFAAFGTRCTSFGRYTQEAVRNAASLRAIVDNIKNDGSCSAVTSALSQVVSAESQIRSLQTADETTRSRERMEADIQELVTVLNAETDPATRDLYTNLLAQRKLSLIGIQNSEDVDLWRRRTEAYSNLLQYSQSLFSALERSSTCVERNPGLLLQVGSQLLSLSAGLNPYSSIAGMALVGVGSIVNRLVTFITNARYARYTRNLDTVTLGSAIGCAIEALTRDHCEARDVAALVRLNSTLRRRYSNPAIQADCSTGICGHNSLRSNTDDWGGVLTSLILLERDMGIFNTWLQSAVAGSPASSSGNAALKQVVIQLRATIDGTSETINAILAEGIRMLANTPDADKNGVRKNIIVG